ncbi:hypothetical protein GQ53DRAFT_496258 [Thozetella sp. PMI_491]|nr:hypothetical protein GQ53DRAFT_496258 [Thozetella sp. PMI_491]
MSEPREPWMPRIPGFLQRLFDAFPLITYPPNELPARSPALSREPTLYVFARDQDEHLGFPSFNPSCLKWQLYLKLAAVEFKVVPSTNHASPTGSLPFLIAPRASYLQPAEAFASSKLYDYAARHGPNKVPEINHLRQDAYQSLLDGPVRKLYLYTLYIEPASTELLRQLYITPTSSAFPIQVALLRQLRRAAEAEILKSTPGAATIDAGQLYAEARDALAALETLLQSSRSQWFWDAEAPTLFDASVFAYMGLLMPGGRHSLWPDENAKPVGLKEASAGAEKLCEHQRRLWNVLLPEPDLSDSWAAASLT